MKLKRIDIRKIIRQTLLELAPPRGFNYEPVQPGAFQKGEWELLMPGDPRRLEIQNVLFDMVGDTYADIGGHVKIGEPGDLERYQYWIVNDIDDDDDPDVLMMAKSELGAKMGGAATDGSAAAATAYKEKGAELRSGGTVGGVGNWWGEVSGKPAYALLSRGAPAIESEGAVASLLGGDAYTWHGAHPDPNAPRLFKSVNGWYTKDFGPGGKHTKIIIGNPTLGESLLRAYVHNLLKERKRFKAT